MKALIVMLVASTLLAACDSNGPPLVIDSLVVTPPLPGSGMSAGYFRLKNESDAIIVIDRVRSPDFASVEMHETRLEDGVSRMRPLEEIRLEPGATIEFSRGGRHLMMKAADDRREEVTLEFFSGATLLLSVSTPLGKRG